MKRPMKRRSFVALATTGLATTATTAFAGAAFAQGTYPDKPITMVVPAPPGGGTDLVTRLYSDLLSQELGVQVIVDNKGGGNGNIGTALVARARPDGYTLLMQYSAYHSANPALIKDLHPDSWNDAARAIMTTDTFEKVASRTARIGDAEVTLNGIAKGSGMIAPDMATMLAFVATDAKIPAGILQTLLAKAVDRSFNCITVDGDTSTSDTLLLVATGQGPKHKKPASATDPILKDFRAALESLLTDLAVQVVRDGEGAEKLITIDVTGAATAAAARRIGLAIANSPLVKTAIAGEDANWGRIVMAVGKSGEKADRDKLAISIGGVEITRNGQRRLDYDETPVAAHIKTRDVRIGVDVGVGKAKARVWTCDLTHRYIEINADYRS